MDRYVIRGGREGVARLQVLGRSWALTTNALFDRVGVTAGMHCLDLGCGGGDVTLELAARVGPHGHLTAVDMDGVGIDVARERTDSAGLTNIEFVASNVYDFEANELFDVAYCRNLLQHLARPVDVLRTMWRSVRPGGQIVVEDADFEGSFCYPPNDGFAFWVERYQSVLRSYGGDPLSGRKLAARFAEAGIPTPQISVVQRADLDGEAKRMPGLTVGATAAAMIEAGIATAEEIDAATSELAAFAEDPASLCGSPRLFQGWSRKQQRSSVAPVR